MIPEAQASISPALARQRILARGAELGFTRLGIARADVPLEEDFARYEGAIAAGLHGPLGYLAENVEARRRLDRDSILEGAKSVIVCAARYDRDDEDVDPPLARAIARYARGQDYHNHLRRKLRNLARFVRALCPGGQARPTTDAVPILEKAWAVRAGVGFLGKNGLVITPGEGSYQLLGEVVTTLEIEPDTPLLGVGDDSDRCGRCTRCLDACPTDAFVRPFVLDAGKCVSTMTIELRGAVPEPLRAATAEHLFGCDVCQEVCPYNAKERPFPPLGDRHRPHTRWASLTLSDLAQLGMAGGPSGDDVLLGTPLARAGVEGIARNACLALSRESQPESLAILAHIADAHPSAIVREAASWAIAARRARSSDRVRP